MLRRSSPGLDTRNVGTMSQYLREMFANTERGFTVKEVKNLLLVQAQFREEIEGNKRAHYRVVARMVARGDIQNQEGNFHATQFLRVQRRGLPYVA